MRTEEINLKQIIEMNMLYETLLNELDIGIHIINEEGKTIIYNRKMMEIESMERSDVLYKSPLEVFAFEENKNSTLIEALKLGKTNKNIKQTYFNNKGQEITTINDTFPIIENGKIKGAIEISKEMNHLKQTIKMDSSRKQNTKFTFDHIIGDSEAIQSTIAEGKRVIRTSSSILLVGETGTGKNYLHKVSIMKVNVRANHLFRKTVPLYLIHSWKAYYLVRTAVHLQELSIKPVYLKKQTEELCY